MRVVSVMVAVTVVAMTMSAATACFLTADKKPVVVSESVSPSVNKAQAPRLPVVARTTLPRRPGLPLDAEQLASILVIDPGLLLISKVIRPRVEVRSGPGVQFNLLDEVLVADQSVIVFERTGLWFKVLGPSMEAVGYVHRDSISDPESSKTRIEIPAARLPTLFAVRRVRNSYDYEGEQRLPVDIPKGAIFPMLKRNKWRALVWLPETNGVVWIDRKEIE